MIYMYTLARVPKWIGRFTDHSISGLFDDSQGLAWRVTWSSRRLRR